MHPVPRSPRPDGLCLRLCAARLGKYYSDAIRQFVGKSALCALRVDDDCDYFVHDRMSSHVQVG